MKLLNKQYKNHSLQIAVLLLSSILSAQVGINKDGSIPDANSILHIKGDATHKNIILETGTDGGVGIGLIDPSHKLTIQAEADNKALRLIGNGTFGEGARLNFGDGDFVFIEEDEDDKLTINCFSRIAFMCNQIGIGTTTPDESAILEINSTTKGLLLPRMTLTQIKDIVDPANGLIVYNTDNCKLYMFISSTNLWTELQLGTGTITPPSTCGKALIDSGEMDHTLLYK
jgi:hypothetical protein